jgi:transposase InsO family protein
MLAVYGFVSSMSRKGDCWDNAVADSFFVTLKNEEATGVYETRACRPRGYRRLHPRVLQSHALTFCARIPLAQRLRKKVGASRLIVRW